MIFRHIAVSEGTTEKESQLDAPATIEDKQ
jgi:hypothetical protein